MGTSRCPKSPGRVASVMTRIRRDGKNVFETTGVCAYTGDIEHELLRRGWVKYLDDGNVVFRGGFLELIEYFGGEFERVAAECNAERVQVPDFMTPATTRDTKYLRFSPHQTLLVGKVLPKTSPAGGRIDGNGDRETARLKKLFQHRYGIKHEPILRLPFEERGVAAASYKLHLDFFTEAFDVHIEGGADKLWSGCAGFGLERWALVFLAQHGPDREAWSAVVRDGIRH
jgi:hypothetical protein